MSETPEARRARLKAAAIKGGNATKAKHAADPDYYKRIASMGGHATRGIKMNRRKPDPNMRRTQTPKPPASIERTIPAGTPTTFDDLDDFMRGLAE